MIRLLLGDRIAQLSSPNPDNGPVGSCSHCVQTAYRIVAVRSRAGAERFTSLCTSHFVEACIMFPELMDMENARTRASGFTGGV